VSDSYRLDLAIPQAQQECYDAIYAAEAAALDATVAEAQSLCPKLTGRNAESIQKRLRRVVGGTKGTVFTESGYGGYIERGTRHTPAHPYIFPAAQHNLPDIPNRARVIIAGITT
jgi:HK97 gp10 family phage protein